MSFLWFYQPCVFNFDCFSTVVTVLMFTSYDEMNLKSVKKKTTHTNSGRVSILLWSTFFFRIQFLVDDFNVVEIFGNLTLSSIAKLCLLHFEFIQRKYCCQPISVRAKLSEMCSIWNEPVDAKYWIGYCHF